MPNDPQAASPSVSPFLLGEAPAPRSFLQKFFLLSKPERARQAIVNRLAQSVDATTPSAISEDFTAFRVNGRRAREVLVGIWADAVRHFLEDTTISNEEAKYLGSLRRALGLTADEMGSVEEELVHSLYEKAVDDALDDDELTLREKARLEDLSSRLRLSKEVADRILSEHKRELITRRAHDAIADGRLSPEELADLHELARHLDIQLQLDDNTRRIFDRLSLMWQIENGQLPTIPVNLKLQKSEVCHAVHGAVWHETRTRTERINYGGPVVSIPIIKGVRYRVGSVRVQRITSEHLTEIDRGTLYLTNKRVIFDGAKKNVTLRLASLLSFTPFSDGVVLEKASGRPPHITLNGDVEVFVAVLSSALASAD